MQTAVGFVRSLYDNENHYRITWGFRTWEQRGGEGRATLGLINGLWRCPSGPLHGFFFLLFYPFSSFTTPLSVPFSVLQKARVKASRLKWKINRVHTQLTSVEGKEETGGGVYDKKQGLWITVQTLSSHLKMRGGRRSGSRWPLALESVGQIRTCEWLWLGGTEIFIF